MFPYTHSVSIILFPYRAPHKTLNLHSAALCLLLCNYTILASLAAWDLGWFDCESLVL